MSARAVLDVQLVGHTVFTPPMDRNVPESKWLFTPDKVNGLDDEWTEFDGQALAEFAGRACYQSFDKPNPRTATNAGYLRHIFEVGHHSILEHGSVTFYITGISRSLTHEFIRHRHLSPSQLSQRYVSTEDLKIVIPPLIEEGIAADVDAAFEKAPDAPESREVVIETALDLTAERMRDAAVRRYKNTVIQLEQTFPEGIPVKKKREAARASLPNSTETRIVMSGNYRAWMHFLEMRDSIHADAEIARLAKEIGRQLAEHAPNIFGADARAIWDKQD